MKTQRELNLEYWGRVHDMCTAYNEKHGTYVKPWECVRYPYMKLENHPAFNFSVERYELAAGILEGKPVFPGDVYYGKRSGCEFVANQGDRFDCPDSLDKLFTRTPPAQKRTFTLNGVELPCPEKDVNTRQEYALSISSGAYWFRTREERDQVSGVICEILTQARDS